MTAVYVQHEPVEEQEQIPPLETKEALVENEEETPFPKSEVPPTQESNDDQKDEVMTPTVLESPLGKDAAIHQPQQDKPATLPAAGKHSVVLKEYLKQVKASKRAKASKGVKASKHSPKGDAPTTEESALETFTASLPPKPDDWGTFGQVSADQQEPPKPRGRKKKNAEQGEDCKASKPKSKARAKAAAKGKPGAKAAAKGKPRARRSKTETAETYEPMPLEEDPRFNKGAAFDAYAAASAALDVHVLGKEESNKENHGKRKGRSGDSNGKAKKSRQGKGAGLGSNDDSKRKSAGETKETSKRTKKCARGSESIVAASDEANTPPETSPTTKAAKRAPRILSAEVKARYSRKSCAYKKVLKQKMSEGMDEEKAKEAARKVPQHFSLKLFW